MFPQCMDPCPEGTWGKQCVHYCSCPVESMECSRIDGNCSCPPGFRGAKCKERTCPDGLYGEGCDRTCECNVENTKLCHAVTGKCECGPGWDGFT
ncbi:multiple epidermal growth factor-like domains protein 11 [Diaphorina citri]|uniref:Multiple epidermal growth factor-like domains protein 11 n=1 Tax=Diaphorina citri TaxID=121845 RepID=A0A3Q0J6F9_DIACI|nr:multiple epidermal growth factor-like domains protein 11 [Diaphorina citri]